MQSNSHIKIISGRHDVILKDTFGQCQRWSFIMGTLGVENDGVGNLGLTVGFLLEI